MLNLRCDIYQETVGAISIPQGRETSFLSVVGTLRSRLVKNNFENLLTLIVGHRKPREPTDLQG